MRGPVAFEDDLSLVAVRRDRTDSAGIFNSQRTRHTLRITEENRTSNIRLMIIYRAPLRCSADH